MDKDNYKVSHKGANGKWWQYGNVRKNRFGNHSLGLKVTPELKKLVADTPDGTWLNMALFEDSGEKKESGVPFHAYPLDTHTYKC